MANPNRKNTTSTETVYAWFPSSERIINKTEKDDPKEIYAKLGSRAPKATPYCDPELLYQYQQSVKPSEFAYKVKQSVDEALKTPWTPHISVSNASENAEKTIPEAFERRVQSAPVYRNLPTTSVILKIPQPTFQRESQHNEVIKHYQTVDRAIQVDDKNSVTDVSSDHHQQNMINSSDSNGSKRSILKQRPSTAHPNLETRQNNSDFKVILSQRPSSSTVNLQQKPSTVAVDIRQYKSLQDVTNKRVKFSGSVMNNHHGSSDAIERENMNSNQNNDQTASTSSPAKSQKSETSWNDRYSVADDRLRTDIKIVDGNWKERLINRRRPCYNVKPNMDKLKPDRMAPELHYNASETYFYNTLPNRHMSFVIHPTFISENLSVKKIDLQNKDADPTKPVRYNRNYAFVY